MKYPFYIVPAVEEYRSLDPNSEEAKKLGRKIAANVGDYASLRLILGIDPPEFAKFYPDMETNTPSTEDTIDSFLDKFGAGLTDSLTYGSSESGYVLADTQAEDEVMPTFSDMIKGKRYSEALEFIESQNLNNPEKSIYFAHQIRFLKKLRAIERHRNKTKG